MIVAQVVVVAAVAKMEPNADATPVKKDADAAVLAATDKYKNKVSI